MKKRNNVTRVLTWVFVGLTALLLIVNALTVTPDTPEYFVPWIEGVQAFVASFDAFLIIVIALILWAGLILYKNHTNKNNKGLMNLLGFAVLLGATYLLLAPGLADAIPEVTWLVDFSAPAVTVKDFITSNQGFIVFGSIGVGAIYLLNKSAK